MHAQWSIDDLMAVITKFWGFDSLRPLQEQAMSAMLEGRDSLVVLPTGGGKSLCYQAPAVLMGGTTLVVSPLIALMKDQVDSLRANGISAVQLDSMQSLSERQVAESDLRRGNIRLLFVSPEKLVGTTLYRTLVTLGVKHIAIDEAHCISHWGHDFRPEYRMMGKLRELVPDASVHAFTATATEQVRADIIAQLALRDPLVLVGNFDRPNLTYRVNPRHDILKQVLEVIDRHQGEAGIIYCLRKRDVDDLTARLRERKINALAYHADLTREERSATQEAFAAERCDIVVATVAFGMGIDRSNVRFVLHTALPKSIEHYQQETGRAGRDSLPAECVLLFSGGDVVSLKAIIEKSAAEAQDRTFLASVFKHLNDMDRFARGAVCRHKALVEYFGQEYTAPNCGACDLCLGDSEEVADANVIAQKILSCVARVKERFGVGHVLGVLRGKTSDGIRKWGHDKLTTYGLLEEQSEHDVRDWIYQLVGQDVLVQTEDEYPILRLNSGSWEVMRGQRSVRLVRLVRRKKGEKPGRSRTDEISWEGVDQALFEKMRELRKTFAASRQVSAFIIFSDATLRELGRVRPTTPEKMRLVTGVSEAKLRDFGPAFLKLIIEHCQETGTLTDQKPPPLPPREPVPAGITSRQEEMFALFRKGMSVEEVSAKTTLARSTVWGYVEAYVRHEKPADLKQWGVDDVTFARVREAARQVGAERIKPIFLALGEKVPYEIIRIVVALLPREQQGS